MSHAAARPNHALRRRMVLAASLPLMGIAPQGPVVWPRIEPLDAEPLEPVFWQDRAAVLVFFRTDCPFCARHNPLVEKLHRAAQGKPLQVLGASVGEGAATVRAYLRERGLSFPVTLQGARLRALFSQRSVVPLTVAVDRRGQLREVIPGEMFEEDVMELLRHAG